MKTVLACFKGFFLIIKTDWSDKNVKVENCNLSEEIAKCRFV